MSSDCGLSRPFSSLAYLGAVTSTPERSGGARAAHPEWVTDSPSPAPSIWQLLLYTMLVPIASLMT